MILEHQSLKQYNTFGIEAKAYLFAKINSLQDIYNVLNYKDELKLPLLILGGGSNILFTKDFDGIVMQINTKGIEIIKETDEEIIIKASAGEIWDEVVEYAVSRNLSGIENLSLIPGSIGASPLQNIGAYGVELKDVFHSLEAMDIKSREIKTFIYDECKFDYRNSVFKNKLKNKYIITSVSLRLSKKQITKTNYGAIEDYLQNKNIEKPSISEIREAICNIRRSKLPDPAFIGNAGSFFKNSIVNKEHFEKLQLDYPNIPFYINDDNSYKIPTGWLIEQCGWKGKTIGNAGVHDKQALVLINKGGASGNEIIQLAENIIQSVFATFGINIEPEVNIE